MKGWDGKGGKGEDGGGIFFVKKVKLLVRVKKLYTENLTP